MVVVGGRESAETAQEPNLATETDAPHLPLVRWQFMALTSFLYGYVKGAKRMNRTDRTLDAS